VPLDHLVPEFYLRNFGNSQGQVLVKTIDGLVKRNVRSSLVIPDFYSDLEEKRNFEETLQITESRSAPIIQAIVAKGKRFLDEEESLQIFEFVCSLYLRSFRSRNLTSDLAEIMKITNFLEVRNQLDGSTSAKHRESLNASDLVISDFQHVDLMNKSDSKIRSVHFDSYKSALVRATRELKSFNLNFIDFERKRLFTCDSPVVLFSDAGEITNWENAEQIYLPLSSKVAIFCVRKESESSLKDWAPSTVLQEIFNDSIELNCRYGLVAHPADDLLIRDRQIFSNRRELEIEKIIDQFDLESDSETQ
jgi:hypothetical protein